MNQTHRHPFDSDWSQIWFSNGDIMIVEIKLDSLQELARAESRIEDVSAYILPAWQRDGSTEAFSNEEDLVVGVIINLEQICYIGPVESRYSIWKKD